MSSHDDNMLCAAGTNTIIRHWDSFGRSLGYSLVGRDDLSAPNRQTTLAYDPATGRLASMQISSEQSNNPNNWLRKGQALLYKRNCICLNLEDGVVMKIPNGKQMH